MNGQQHFKLCDREIQMTVAQGRLEATAEQAGVHSTADEATVMACCKLLQNREKQRKW